MKKLLISVIASLSSGLTGAAQPTVTAWLNKYDWQAAVSSVQKNAAFIQEASPAWYRPNADGSVAPIPASTAHDPIFLQQARDKGLPVVPLLMNTASGSFDASVMQALLIAPRRVSGRGAPAPSRTPREKHIAAIGALLHDNGYGGIIVDYENFDTALFPAFAEFIEELAAALHATGKTLGVTAQPDHLTTKNANAWQRIGGAADLVYLMAYSEHGPHTAPGPIASLSWVNTQINKALAVIPTRKLSLGLATYALVWATDPSKNTSGSWAAIVAPEIARGTNIVRDADSDVPHFMRASDGATVWYEDAGSIKRKTDLARSFGIHHFALWRLGGEDPALWQDF